MVHSESRTRLDNLTKIQSSNAWISSWNAQMLHFPLCEESVLGMPRIEIEFEFDMVFCFGIRLAPYAFSFFFFFFHSDLPSSHCTTCWKWSSYKHRVYGAKCMPKQKTISNSNSISILGIPSTDSRHNGKCNICAFHEEIYPFEDWIFVRLSSLVLASEWTTNRKKFVV